MVGAAGLVRMETASLQCSGATGGENSGQTARGVSVSTWFSYVCPSQCLDSVGLSSIKRKAWLISHSLSLSKCFILNSCVFTRSYRMVPGGPVFGAIPQFLPVTDTDSPTTPPQRPTLSTGVTTELPSSGPRSLLHSCVP